MQNALGKSRMDDLVNISTQNALIVKNKIRNSDFNRSRDAKCANHCDCS